MCGIGGIVRIDGQPINQDRLEKMRAWLDPRGPDGWGIEYVDSNNAAAFVHTRLSVVDLMGGHQPMKVPATAEHGELTLVFNGEIYNHRTLRKRLTRRGHPFVSDHCDTEVLLHGYREWGTELPKHLHGMFAFAIWDSKRKSVFMARDRIGKKPLYLWWDAKQLVFGSLLGALLAGLDQTPDIDPMALAQYLTFGYTTSASLLEGILELPAGHWMLMTAEGPMDGQSYWQPPPLSRSSTKLGAVPSIDEVLNDAVSRRLEADVPLGCFLSGGIDSSLIAAMAQRHAGTRLKTFSVAMPDARYDESPYARQVATHLGTEHHELHATADVEGDLMRLVQTFAEPTADSSVLPTYWLSKATREHVTVALSGDGGDELFGGYDRYRALRLLGRWRGVLKTLPHVLVAGRDQKSWTARLGRLINAAKHRNAASQYMELIRIFTPQQLGWLGMPATGAADQLLDWESEADPAEAARRWDLQHYLPYDLLRKVDRAAMAVSLEVRCPMLDTQVMDLAGHLPLTVLMPGGRSKALLRQVAAKYVPAAIVKRPKAGFAVPIGSWFRKDLSPMLRDWLLRADRLETVGFRLARVGQMLDDHVAGRTNHTHRLFALLTLSMWLDWLADPKPPATE